MPAPRLRGCAATSWPSLPPRPPCSAWPSCALPVSADWLAGHPGRGSGRVWAPSRGARPRSLALMRHTSRLGRRNRLS